MAIQGYGTDLKYSRATLGHMIELGLGGVEAYQADARSDEGDTTRQGSPVRANR